MSLLAAADFGSMAMCRLLLAAGVDVEERSPITLWTPLHHAAGYGHVSSVQFFRGLFKESGAFY